MINYNIEDNHDTTFEQFKLYFQRWYHAETGTCINMFPMLEYTHLSTIVFAPTNIKRVITARKRLRKGESDEVTISLMKYGSRARPLSCIVLYNLYMDYRVYPSVRETWLITPAFKTRSHRDTSNYRSIIVTYMMSTIMEKVVYGYCRVRFWQGYLFLFNACLWQTHPWFASHMEFFDKMTQRTNVGWWVIFVRASTVHHLASVFRN